MPQDPYTYFQGSERDKAIHQVSEVELLTTEIFKIHIRQRSVNKDLIAITGRRTERPTERLTVNFKLLAMQVACWLEVNFKLLATQVACWLEGIGFRV